MEPTAPRFKAADEWFPVDTEVQATFDALYHVYQINPTLVNTGKATLMAPMPNDDVTGHPFRLPNVAYEFPGGSYVRLYTYLDTTLKTEAGANELSSGLGEEIFDWSVASVDVGAVLGAQPGAAVSLSWDRSSSVKLIWFVPPENDRIEVTITRSATGVVSVHFDGILDIDDNYYPSADGDMPQGVNHAGFPHHGGDHFSEGMQSYGISVPAMPECGYTMHPFQTITRQGGPTGHIVGVAYSCVQN